MRLPTLAVCLAAFALLVRHPVSAQQSKAKLDATAARQQIVGYFPQWGVYNNRYLVRDLIRSGAMRTLTQIDYAQTNIVDNSCNIADPQADLNIAFTAENSVDGNADDPASLFKGNLHQLQLLKARYPKLRVLISIEGKRASFEDAAKPENRAAFVHSCVARFLDGHLAPGVEAPRLFDGIDVDWEYPDTNHADDFYALMAEFRRQMDAARHGMILSIASGASIEQNVKPIDWHRVAASVDQIGVMTYDYQGPWSHTTGFNAPLRSTNPHDETVAQTIDAYTAAGAPPQKLLLGLPFYAYQWHAVASSSAHGLRQQGDPVRGNLNQSTVTSLLAGQGAALYRDPASQAPWVYDGDNFLTFEDPTSLQEKAHYAAEQHLGGMMIWELSGDSADSQLLQALQLKNRQP